jgi:hypothetical protein
MPYEVFTNSYAENIDVYWAPGVVSRQTGLKPSVELASGTPVKIDSGALVAIGATDVPYGILFHTTATDEYGVVIKPIPGVEIRISTTICANVAFAVGDVLYWSTVNKNYTNAAVASDTVEIGKVVEVQSDYIVAEFKY